MWVQRFAFVNLHYTFVNLRFTNVKSRFTFINRSSVSRCPRYSNTVVILPSAGNFHPTSVNSCVARLLLRRASVGRPVGAFALRSLHAPPPPLVPRDIGRAFRSLRALAPPPPGTPFGASRPQGVTGPSTVSERFFLHLITFINI